MIIIHLQAYNTGLQRRWVGAMDGNIDLTMQLFVQGENSKLVLEAEDTPGLFFIGGMQSFMYLYSDLYCFYLQNMNRDVPMQHHLVCLSFLPTCQALTTLDSGQPFLGFLQIPYLVYQHSFPAL